jgi:hypothetical protein
LEDSLLTTLGRRSAQRICVRVDVGILDEQSGERALGQLRDLSATGACLRTPGILPIGKSLRMAFEFESGHEAVRLHAEVMWSGQAETPRGGVLSGVRFLDLAGPDFGRLRAFIDQKLWTVQRFLCSMELFADLSDLEKLLLASVAYDRELQPDEPLEESASQDSLIIVRDGMLECVESTSDGRSTPTRTVAAGEVCGSLPIDARGTSRVKLKAVARSALLCIPSEGFWYLWNTHAETALKLLSCWCLSLRDRLLAVEPLP